MEIVFKPIGIIHTPFHDAVGIPVQPAGGKGIKGTVDIHKEFVKGLKDLIGFSHIHLIYYLHQSKDYNLEVVPFLDDQLRGVFSTRAPRRPNAIGLSVVKLMGVEDQILHIEDVDMLDGTPLLDIKPYIPEVDIHHTNIIGWLTGKRKRFQDHRSDKRFSQ
jgi:tRNA-Thr(GGU) m(6)t(6)A37 methyltransferase TsaA